MEHGQVRAILGRHAHVHPGRPPTEADAARPADPTLLVPASSLRKALDARDEAGQRALALDYVRLWARTFRTLARHLRGRPERALALFAEEVYPFLRGDRRAARVERVGRHEARLLLPGDLPAAYHCGLLEGFVGLSGAEAVARFDGAGVFTVAFRVAPADRVARTAQHLAALRLPILACALLAALTGVTLAAAAGFWHTGTAIAVLLGTVAAQVGANTLHELRRPAGSPLAASRLPRGVLRAANTAAYGVAAACAFALVAWNGPGILVFAGIGLLLGVAYSRVRDEGLGPLVAGATYGLLIPGGAMFAFEPGTLASPIIVPLLGAPLGLMAAALLLLDNMADRPLDEAGGQRTLAVRLPGHRQSVVFAALVALALAWLAMTSWPSFSPFPLLAAALLSVPAWFVVLRVHRAGGDPHALGPARLATFALLVAVALSPIAFVAAWGVGA